jgi:hypothetical protein
MFVPGVSFASDGHYYRLLSDGDGGVVQAAGVLNQGTWALDCYQSPATSSLDQPCTLPGVSLYLNSVGGDSDLAGCAEGLVSFEGSPRRMYFGDESCGGPPGLDLWLVPVP